MGRNLGAGAVAAMLPALMAVAVLQVSPARAAAAIAGSTCTSVGISTDFPSPQKVGATVTVTPDATGCPNGNWSIPTGRDFAHSSTTFSWSTGGLAPGIYQVGVWARDQHSPATFDAYWISTYTLLGNGVTGAACVSADLSAPQSPESGPGVTVNLTATSTGCAIPT